MRNISYIFKIIAVGSAQTEKAAFLENYEKYIGFSSDTSISIGVSFGIIDSHHEDIPLKLQIWDFKNSSRFRSFFGSYFRGAKAALLFFDISNRDSFEELKYWVSLIRYEIFNAPVIIISSKSAEISEIEDWEIKDFTEQYGIAKYFEYFNPNPQDSNTIIEYFIEKIVSYSINQDAVSPINYDNLVPLEDLESFFYPISSGYSNFNYKKYTKEEMQYFHKFIEKFSRCPICGSLNHMNYLRSFFFSNDLEKNQLRDDLLLYLEKCQDGNCDENLVLGIPCCNCFRNFFNETPSLY